MEKKHERSPLTKSMNYKSLNEDIFIYLFRNDRICQWNMFFSTWNQHKLTHAIYNII